MSEQQKQALIDKVLAEMRAMSPRKTQSNVPYRCKVCSHLCRPLCDCCDISDYYRE